MRATAGMFRWRCVKCVATGVGVSLQDATLRVILHGQRVHPEDHEKAEAS